MDGTEKDMRSLDVISMTSCKGGRRRQPRAPHGQNRVSKGQRTWLSANGIGPRGREAPAGAISADENRGRLNLLAPEKVRRGPALALSPPLDLGGNRLKANRLPPAIRPNLPQGHVHFNRSVGALNDTTPAVLDLQYSTPRDSLAHAC